MEAQSKPVIVARNPSVVPKQKRIEPLPSGYAVRELCNDSEGHYWYVVGTWSLLSSLIDLQNLVVHRSRLEAALVQPALDLVFREADVRPNPYVRDDSPLHVPVDRLVVTESRLRVDGMAGAQQWRSRWVLPETPTAGWEFWARIEKICATENLGQAEGIYLTRTGKGRIPLKPFSVKNPTTEGSHGRESLLASQ